MTTDLLAALQETMAAVSRFEANLGEIVVPLEQNTAAIYLARQRDQPVFGVLPP